MPPKSYIITSVMLLEEKDKDLLTQFNKN